MPLSWNEIQARAGKFSVEWKDAYYEKGQTQTFYNEFFEVFGRRRRDVAIYEQKVKKLNDHQGFIDLFWPGQLLIEQKSAGRSLDTARKQATDYFLQLKEAEKPRFILLSDFQNFEMIDLETRKEYKFPLSKLVDNIRVFDFIAGYHLEQYKDQPEVNIEAALLMAELHEKLEKSGYKGIDLERLLVRLMFCLFADDTGIFDPDIFLHYVEIRTKEDGHDLGSHLIHLFQILDTPVKDRQKNLDEDLNRFPHVNGKLFSGMIRTPSFDSEMREALLKCCRFKWNKVSPALFGSLFQIVMLPEEQRKGGAHYTSERNILKTIHPLFLDELREEFRRIKDHRGTQKNALLKKFHDHLGTLTFLDPACGCGNFLILAYRELRLLELEVLEALHPQRQLSLNVEALSIVDVDQFYGIEIEEFPAYIAEAAMWLVDHQMNMALSESFGQSFVRLPLKKSANIVHGNALTTRWEDVIPPQKLKYILGNPPFVGQHYQTAEKKTEQQGVMAEISAKGVLDYVCNWYLKAAKYIQNTAIKVAFVSTNSICQGEQVGILWSPLLHKYGITIHFAHRTFKWTIDEKKAKGMKVAGVHAVIIGFAAEDTDEKYLYEYETYASDPHRVRAKNISPYLVDAPSILIHTRTDPISNVPHMQWGNKPTDGGHFLLSPDERRQFLAEEPASAKYIRQYMSGGDFLNSDERYCLWLKDADPHELRNLPLVTKRVQLVREERLKSKAPSTRKSADTPTLFRQIAQPDSDYLAVPEVSSEKRKYIPIAFVSKDVVCSNTVQFVPNATPYHFGVLTSVMHMEWMRYVCGRLESRYRYSNSLVYNNFPWPDCSDDKRKAIEQRATAILALRERYKNSTLADLYDPLAMPEDLLKAHQELDKVVDASYRKQPFNSERERIEFLFDLYQRAIVPLSQVTITKKKSAKKTVSKSKLAKRKASN